MKYVVNWIPLRIRVRSRNTHHLKKFDEIRCELDSIENPRSFEKYPPHLNWESYFWKISLFGKVISLLQRDPHVKNN